MTVLACVLALSSADAATVGASAIELRQHLHINNTDIGLLVAVSSLVGAVAALPFGVLADRVRRTWTLSIAVALWGVAMLWSATAGSFGELLLARLALGVVTAAAGPIVASLVGDYFPGRERGRIYSFILTGELVGAGIGFAVTGDIAALSWRAAFVILAIPAFVLAYLRLPPARAGPRRPRGAARRPRVPTVDARGPRDPSRTPSGITDAQRLALDRHIAPDPRLVREGSVERMGFIAAARYVLHVRTNVALIVSGALGYYFLAGVQTFGVEFVHTQYHVNQVLANLLMLVVGGGAAAGVLIAGPLGDRLLGQGHLNGRIQVAAYAAVAHRRALHPGPGHPQLRSPPCPTSSWPGAALSAQNPPIDAARLDIVPALLWGRAEGIRTFVRTGAQALAPLLFGAVSDLLSGSHPYSGLRWTFVIMLLPLSASAFFLFRAMRTYPTDVATAGVVTQATRAKGPSADDAAGPPDPGSER